MSRLVLAYDLGGTNVRCGVLNEKFEILSRAKTSTGKHPKPEDVAKKMAGMAEEVLHKIGKSKKDLAVAGIGSPGPLNSQTGMIYETPNIGWHNVPLAALLEKELGVQTFLENDAVAACWGEYIKGAGANRGIKTMFILTLGTGVGGALIIDGKVWKGIDDTAGHLGHMVIWHDGPTQVRDNPGSVEALCSATACIRDAREAAKKHPKSLLAKVPLDEINGKYVDECAAKGDEAALGILTRIGYFLGVTCASLANAFNPELGLIGGGLAASGDKLLVPLRKELNRRSLDNAGKRLKVELAKLGDDAGMTGAAGLALLRHDGKI
jgi:glucokinase